jgi:hypothetical protein
MSNPETEDDVYAAWYAALVAEDFEKALQIAAEAYARAAIDKNTESMTLFRKFIRLAAGETGRGKRTTDPSLPTVCSFCGEKIGAKKFVQGPSAKICETCITLAAQLVSP